MHFMYQLQQVFGDRGFNVLRCSNTVELLYKGYLWRPTFCPLQRSVPNSGASGIFPVGVVLRNPAVENSAEYSVATFSVAI